MTKIRDNYSHIQIALHWLIVLLFVFNYILADGSDPETMDHEEIFRRVKPYFFEQITLLFFNGSRLTHLVI